MNPALTVDVLLAGAKLRDARDALEALSRRSLALRPSALTDASLAGGHAGIALAHAALDMALPGRGHASAAERALGRALRAIETTALQPDLYSGLAGIAWVAEILTGDPSVEDDPLANIDTALEGYLVRSDSQAQSRWHEPFDLYSGLVGIGVYALERMPRASGKRLLGHIVSRLAETARRRQPGRAWWSDPEWVPPEWRTTPHPAWNLGVAHGVPGVIAFLGRTAAANVDTRTKITARALLDGAVEWLLAQELPPNEVGCFARAVAPGIAREPARLAWCYGDPGIAAALLIAARGAQNVTWERAAMRVALRAAARPVETAEIVDAGLCHGAAGVAHIFHRLAIATREERLARAARSWFARTLAMRDSRRGFAGFRAWGHDAKGGLSWQPDPGFLNGTAGVTLALVAAATDTEPAWDRALLLS